MHRRCVSGSFELLDGSIRSVVVNLVTTFRHLIVGRLRWLLANGDERDAEILALRHQILVLQRQINRPRFNDTDRTILAVLSTAFERSWLHQVMLIVQPKLWPPSSRSRCCQRRDPVRRPRTHRQPSVAVRARPCRLGSRGAGPPHEGAGTGSEA